MEGKLIALVLIALIAGLGGGYGLGYLVYQPQVQNLREDLSDLTDRFDILNSTLRNAQSSMASLQNDMDDLNSKVTSLDSAVDTMEGRKWHEVYSLASSSDATSGTIPLKGSQVRAMWIASSTYSDAWLSIVLHFSNGTEYAVWGSSGVWTANNAVLELPQPGNYYLTITTNQTSYALSFWDYY